ncbi:related to alcohol oxidase [Rhynchosporium agropyri]|uniref:Related to alcohol oxidase n=1 Tax=Rhynchosporium agropyri TaxID=914238 RepID=A0A1E1LB47_9HELO|nr:related to alcohol oxidase [Rhynchosporium agropyri]
MNSLSILTIFTSFWACDTFAYPNSVHQAQHHTHSDELHSSYDYIVVGGGTAGLTIADRLTESGRYSVLVVEYGYFSDIPTLPYDPVNPIDSSPESLMYNITSVGTRKQLVGIGCVVGGGSAINAQAFMRGTSEDYDRWGALGGKDSAWNWKNLLPYFQKSCTFNPPDPELAAEFNITYDVQKAWGGTGPVLASYGDWQYPPTKIMYEAWKVFPGITYPRDGSEGQAGILWIPSSKDPTTETRSYARTAHYDPVRERSNYAILTGHKVAKILTTGRKNDIVATSVQVISRSDNSSLATIKARKEIILAAGAIHSPQILQLSGIGPKEVLKAANVSLVLDLPGVGSNFQDHSWFAMGFNFTTPILPSRASLLNNKTFAAWALELWEANRTGPYSIAQGGGAALAQVSLPVIAPDTYPTIATSISQLDPASALPPSTDRTIIAGYRLQLHLMARAVRCKNTAWFQMGLGGNPFGSPDQWVFNIHPLSRGTVHLDPADPHGEPLVDYRMLSNPIDLRVAIALFRGTRAYFGSGGAMKLLSPVETKPGVDIKSDADIGTFLKRTLDPSQYHPVGTCAKMPLELGGVVDEELMVHGVHGLSVVDASIMPLIVGATTQATVYAVAEKAADLIKARA